MRVILLIMIGLSLLQAELTRDAATGIVSDSTTGLMWQDNEIGTTTNWQGAIDRCEELELGDYSDWRLPNVNELKSILDRSKVDPAIKDGFEHTSSSNYWSSTTTLGNPTPLFIDLRYAFQCGFLHGSVGFYLKHLAEYNASVRCVRGGP